VHLRNREPVDFFTTYNGFLGANQVLGSWDRYQQKDLNREVLMSYGHGDGGGGTTEEMVENQRRLARGLPVSRVRCLQQPWISMRSSKRM